jgi:hypothetical protein
MQLGARHAVAGGPKGLPSVRLPARSVQRGRLAVRAQAGACPVAARPAAPTPSPACALTGCRGAAADQDVANAAAPAPYEAVMPVEQAPEATYAVPQQPYQLPYGAVRGRGCSDIC